MENGFGGRGRGGAALDGGDGSYLALNDDRDGSDGHDHFAMDGHLGDFRDDFDEGGVAFDETADALADRMEGALLDGRADDGARSRTPADREEAEPDEPLPEWACAYCGVNNPACVVRCLKTGKWFCNGRQQGCSASCAVFHLVRSKSKEVCLHRDSPLGETILECYASGARNVFTLGFVPLQSQSTVVILSRNCQAGAPELRNLDLDLTSWQPLIEDRQFVPWLVRVPQGRDLERTRPITQAQMTALEELWMRNPTATVEDIGEKVESEGASPVCIRYEDAYHYQNIYGPLLKLEADYDKTLAEAQRKEGIEISWEALGSRLIAIFCFPIEDSDVKLGVGDELLLKHPSRPDWVGKAKVASMDAFGTVEVILPGSREVPSHLSSNFTVERTWNDTSFKRMHTALTQFAVNESSVAGYLYLRILGHDAPEKPLPVRTPDNPTAPGLPKLNPSQQDAVKSVLAQPLALIQGPPGTGKTVTSATIVYHIAKQNAGQQVLVAAPSNVAVDHLAEKIAATGLRVVRLCARAREDTEVVSASVVPLTLHYQVRNADVPEAFRLRALMKLKDEIGVLHEKDSREMAKLRNMLEREALSAAEVVCCTCSGAGDPRMVGRKFRHVLIDEATQACEPECLIPIVKGARQVVLVGDHCQLGPVVMCKAAAKAGLNLSLYERLILMGIRPVRLQVQYRMHPCLSLFPSNTYYEGTLQNGVSEAHRTRPEVDFPWPGPTTPMMFLVSLGAEELSGSSTSYLNRAEAQAVEKVVTRFLMNGVDPAQIGVITPYDGQRAHVEAVMQRPGPLRQELYKAVEVASVDAFQGREKDYVVLSCVRSNDRQGIGFLREPRRLNVALTRARYGLVVVGNPRVLAKHPLWNSLLTHMSSLGCIVEGTLAHLRPSTVAFPIQRRPFQYVPEAHLALLSAHTAHDAPPRPDYEDPDAARAPNGAQPQPLFSVPAFNPFSGLSTPARPGSQQSQQGLAPPFLDPFAAYLGSAPRSQGAWSDYSLASQPSVAGRRESKNYQR